MHGTFIASSFCCFVLPWAVSGNPSSNVTRCPFARTRFISKRPPSLSLVSLCAFFFTFPSRRWSSAAARFSDCPMHLDMSNLFAC